MPFNFTTIRPLLSGPWRRILKTSVKSVDIFRILPFNLGNLRLPQAC